MPVEKKIFQATSTHAFDCLTVINIDPSKVLGQEFTDLEECYHGVTTESGETVVVGPGAGIINVIEVDGEDYVFGYFRHNPDLPADADRQFCTAIGGALTQRAQDSEYKADFILKKTLKVAMDSKTQDKAAQLLQLGNATDYSLQPYAVVYRHQEWKMCYVTFIRKMKTSDLSVLQNMGSELTYSYEARGKRNESRFDAIKLSDLIKIAKISAPIIGEAQKSSEVESCHAENISTVRGDIIAAGKLKIFDDNAFNTLFNEPRLVTTLKPVGVAPAAKARA